MKKEHTKKIKILSKGVLPCKGFIYGPVLTPYQENVDTIFQLIASGVEVIEVTDSGNEILLTTSNFEEDHSAKAIAEKEAAKKEAEAKKKAEEEKRIKAAEEEDKAKKKAEEEKRIKAAADREAAKNRQNSNNKNNQSHTSVVEETKLTDETLEQK